MQVDLKQFEGMAVQHARKNKEQEEDDLDLKNRRAPKAQKDKALKEVGPASIPLCKLCRARAPCGSERVPVQCSAYSTALLYTTVAGLWLWSSQLYH